MRVEKPVTDHVAALVANQREIISLLARAHALSEAQAATATARLDAGDAAAQQVTLLLIYLRSVSLIATGMKVFATYAADKDLSALVEGLRDLAVPSVGLSVSAY